MKSRLGKKWRKKTQKSKDELNKETQTSFTYLPIKDEEQIQAEEVEIKVTTPIKTKKIKKTSVVELQVPTKKRSSYTLEVKDSLLKHRRSLIPKIDEAEYKKSCLSLSRDSLELARESFHSKTVLKRAQDSKLSLARDSVEIIRVLSFFF